jgi:hypothetical protein
MAGIVLLLAKLPYRCFGGNFDLYTTDKTFIQSTIARAWNVTDGFNGLTVLPNNPLTGEPVLAPVVMRFTPSAKATTISEVMPNETTAL